MPRFQLYERQVSASTGATIDLPRVDARAFGGQIGEALEGAGQALNRRAAIAEQEAEDSDRLLAARALAETRGAALKFRQAAREEAPEDGAGHREKVLSEFDRLQALAVAKVQSPKVRQQLETQMVTLRADIDLDEDGYVTGLKAAKVAGDAQAGIEATANTLYTDGTPDMLMNDITLWREAIGGLSVPPEVKTKLTRYAENRLARSLVEGLAERDPFAAKALLKSGVLNDVIDADNMTGIGNRVDAEIRGRQAQARMEALQRRAAAQAAAAEAQRAQRDAISAAMENGRDLRDLLVRGGYASPEDVGAAARTMASLPGGRALARDLALLGVEAQTTAALRGASPQQVAAARLELDAKIAARGGRPDMATTAQRNALDRYERQLSADLKADPLARAAREGVVQLAPLNPNEPATFQARARQARQIADRYNVPLPMLDDAEVANYGRVLTSGTAQDREAVLKSLQQFGPTGAAAALRQLTDVAPVAAHAGRLLSTPGGARVSSAVLRGAEALKANPKLVPETAMRDDVDAATRKALRFLPELQTTTADTARSWLAGRLSETGQDFKPDMRRKAANVVLGGRRHDDGVMRGGLGERNNVPVLLPGSMSQDEFDDAIDGISLARTPPEKLPMFFSGGKPTRAVTPQDIRDGTLFALPNGRYAVATDKDGVNLIRRKDGTLFEIIAGGQP